jgi:hypothetical protein
MLNPIITPPRVPLVDPSTGLINRAWYLFFLSLNNVANAVVNDPDVGPSPESLIASYDALLQTLTQEVETQPLPVDASVELAKQIDAAVLTPSSAGLLSTVSEMQKQIDALNSLPPVLPSPITNGSSILYGDNLGGFSNVTIGSGISFSGGTLSATGSGGTVTSVSVVSANGFAGTVATATTTPAITLTTSISGLLKGNGTAISAAVANTDYVPLSTVLTKTADYTITGTDTWIINNKSGSAMTLTFPAASAWPGRYITVKNMQAQLVNSASSNIVPIDSTTAGTAILLAVVGNWATMVSDGTNWVIMQQAANNNLLLE